MTQQDYQNYINSALTMINKYSKKVYSLSNFNDELVSLVSEKKNNTREQPFIVNSPCTYKEMYHYILTLQEYLDSENRV